MDKTLVQFKIEATKRKVTEPIKKFWKETKKAASDAWDWAKENPTEAIVIASAVAGGVYKGARLITRNREIRHDKFITDCRMYDRKYDEYVCSKRKLTNDEALYVQRMYDKGQSKRQSLIDLGLIKD